MYTVKSEYWVAKIFFTKNRRLGVAEPNIARLQGFVWKINAPHKMHRLIWQIVSGYLAVTRDLTRRHIMKITVLDVDNWMNRLTMPFFQCPPSLQTWVFASTPSCQGNFPILRVYANLDYLLWQKSDIEHPELERDPYLWILWYLQKSRNNKLFRRITWDPVELIRHAQSECNAWFDAKIKILGKIQTQHQVQNTQALPLENIVWQMDLGSRNHIFWIWMDIAKWI